MILRVDFNMREADGRLPALLAGVSPLPTLGEAIVAADGEGLECSALISEISDDGRYVMLQPIGGTYHDSDYVIAAGDVFA